MQAKKPTAPKQCCEAGVPGWRQVVEDARANFDARLASALKGALLLSQRRADAPSAVTYSGGGVPLTSAAGRGAVLQPYVQDKCTPSLSNDYHWDPYVGNLYCLVTTAFEKSSSLIYQIYVRCALGH